MDIEEKKIYKKIENYIVEYFKRYEFGDYNELDNNTKEQLINIEKYFITSEEELNKLIKKKNEIKLDIVGISCKVDNLGRTTIYKKDILKNYINKRVGIIKNKYKDIMISDQYKMIEEKYRESETLIEQVKIELIDVSENRIKIEKLDKEVKKLNSIIRRHEKEKKQYVDRIYILQKELNAYKERSSVKDNVVSFNKRKW